MNKFLTIASIILFCVFIALNFRAEMITKEALAVESRLIYMLEQNTQAKRDLQQKIEELRILLTVSKEK